MYNIIIIYYRFGCMSKWFEINLVRKNIMSLINKLYKITIMIQIKTYYVVYQSSRRIVSTYY